MCKSKPEKLGADILMWHFETSQDNLEQTADWYAAMPEFLKTTGAFSTQERDELLKGLQEGENYKGFIDGKFAAAVHGDWKDEKTIEGHLFTGPDVDIDFVATMVTYAKIEALKKAEKVVTQIPTKHKILHEVMRRSGFIDVGLFCWQSVYKGNLLENKYYIAARG